jgi:mannose/fructose/N-acetylgalactosamine-specific phosphotransferase system component IID
MNKLVVHIHDNTYIHGKYESTDQNGSCSIVKQVQNILDKIFGAASSAATLFFISLLNVLLKLTIIIHQHFCLLFSIVQLDYSANSQ